MADVLVGPERRVLISGYGLPTPAPPAPPPPESLLGRLDQIDLRLRQLEEQRRPAPADDGAVVRRAPPQHHHTKSLPSALQHVQVRGTLMDRLNLLESRIRQLSCELDLDVGGKAGAGSCAAAAQLGLGSSSSVAPPPVEDPAWSDTAPMSEPCRDPAAAMMPAPASKPAAAPDGSWSAVEILQRGARQLHRNKTNPPNKVKNVKEAKCVCQKEKRKAERGRTSRRWFTVGC
ncbi:hypothetical protein C2845_PM10G00200 [Panicum miliaceum]|uniref:Uncharacterized protein n=1 Tax=Panicum miliaceum TaxID=4540 RepID=A0A3L6PAF5_PANMI|nr:hypothetical protein C2845_PM10G00200 [Panicum miliaceum]